MLGNIKDASDAAVPAAEVTVRQSGTGFSRQTQTNEAGQFQFPALPGGLYEITVAKTGFTTYSAKGLNIAVNAATRVDATLQIGAVAESVNVEAAPPALQTDRAEVRSEITAKQFENAPLPPGRNYTQLFKTLPGFTSPRNGNGPSVDPSRAAIYNVNGTSRSSNAVRIEGAGVNQVHIMQCDVGVTADEWIDPAELTSYKVTGFGGSDMSPAMDRLAEDPDVAAVLVLTDGMIDYPQAEPGYAVQWGVVEAYSGFHPRYGNVVRIRG